MAETDQLLIPNAAKADPKSFELLRVWTADKGQHVSLRSGVWNDPAAWGLLLADLARHITNAYQQDAGTNPLEARERIKAGFYVELDSPTDEPSGQIGH
jgi:Domain of unknown function (DUF5076)